MGSELFEVESFEIYDQVLRILASVFLSTTDIMHGLRRSRLFSGHLS